MGWTDNRNKGVRDISKEERLAWLRAQIEEMEGSKTPPAILAKIKPRIRRNGVYVDGK